MKELIDTIQEQINRAKGFGIDEHNPHEAVNLSINQAETILTALQQTEWVSVEDRLPTPFTTITIYCSDGENTAIYLDGCFQSETGQEFNHVTHWKHLSTPPKEQ